MQILSAKHAFTVLQKNYSQECEEVWCLTLNTKLHIISKHLLFRGTIDHCMLHPRDVFRCALKANASKILIAHNHPSEDLEPSDPDIEITKRLAHLGCQLEIPLVDHIIFNKTNYLSLAEQGYLYLPPVGS